MLKELIARDSTTNKICKCGKILPVDYKFKKCESCRNKTLDTVRKAGKVAAIALTVGVTFIYSLSKET